MEYGYEETENLVVLKEGEKYTVKEGNRRTACLKIILGMVDTKTLPIREDIADAIKEKSPEWKAQLNDIPCVVFSIKEKDKIDRIVSRIHGKNEDAQRDEWESVATARHNRDQNKVSEPGLDLLEAYLVHASDLTDAQKIRWAGDYHLTVVNDFISKYHRRLGATSGKDLVSKYPENLGDYRKPIEEVLFRIGTKDVGFAEVRSELLGTYGIPSEVDSENSPTASQPTPSSNPPASTASTNDAADSTQQTSSNNGSVGSNGSAPPQPMSAAAATSTTVRGRNRAVSQKDPKSVKSKLRKYHPRGVGNEKLADLSNELKELKIEKTPLAFCFVLRSMFEIAAKTYGDRKSIATTNSGGDRKLVEILKDIANQLIGTDKKGPIARELMPAIKELTREDGLLSVTAMNQLIHSKVFHTKTEDVCLTFHQIFPLLDHMTR